MLGLFGTLNLGAESLQVQQRGVEVAGHNLANVNNTAYARQRVVISTANAIPSQIGPQGTGAQVVRIEQLRNAMLEGQLLTSNSVMSFLQAQQSALEQGQAILGQTLDTQASRTAGASSSDGQHGLAEGLADLFSAFQSLSANPSDLTLRQSVLSKAQALASQFNQVDGQLDSLNASLNTGLDGEVGQANKLLESIAQLNRQIVATETNVPGSANDLRDLRQQTLTELGKLVNIQASEQPNGIVNVTISGTTVVSGIEVADTLETYDAGGGQMLVRTQTGQNALNVTTGSIGGTIDARDGALQQMREDVNGLAGALITEVNNIHKYGYGLNGTTGQNFFSGSSAKDIAVQSGLLADPAALQASGTLGAGGDNTVILELAQLAQQRQAALGNTTFTQNFSAIVGNCGQALASVNSGVEDQGLMQNMLESQRDSVSGVSVDEEMTDLMKYQKAYEASAKLITTIDEMLETVLSLKR
jgi:flagellar hook-associated protein 1